ncbi:MAG: helix-turn-helix domain-containing protein, partial [Microvirga sp.]
ARLDAMTDEEITRAAESDPDNPPLTEEEMVRGLFARDVRLAREKTDLSQEHFAAQLGIPLPMLRDWEEGRLNPDPAARALIRLVSRDPEHILALLAA